ncbi:aconitase X [Limibacillus sp. MBR-115]|jgi:predicted aconitase/predicted aconitase with swiveling domain|uniref:cis-3-hydroxy-L-proline dehydratase n=1 Tax=Limibacillus sp. MBR-115 TaxID=3156465 RepID=UPI0033936B54
MAQLIVPAAVEGPVLTCSDGLSFWGGVDPETGRVIDAHHDQHGQLLTGCVVLMPTSRGSCTGSGVLLELTLNGNAPAALVFKEDEDILTLGAMIAGRMFERPLAVLRVPEREYEALSKVPYLRITETAVEGDGISLPLAPLSASDLNLTAGDRSLLSGARGPAAKFAMETLCAMAALQGADRLIDVTRVHIDGCIYASPANLRFAAAMAEMNAKVVVPTTMNAISVDYANWRSQKVPPEFGLPASQLADAYVRMGARPSFTCAPYHLDDKPLEGEDIGWSESNAVIYANSVLGARTAKHPDFLDLFIALTGRAPHAGVYLETNRAARRKIEVELPVGYDDALWPLLGWLAGQLSPDRIPALKGLEATAPSEDDLRALCAAFGTTSAAPMLHVAGITPEGNRPATDDADCVRITRADLARAWKGFNAGGGDVDLVSLGSPHFSLAETRKFAALMEGRRCHPAVSVIITLGRETLATARDQGLAARLEKAGVQLIPDICWCSISEPVFPPQARVLMTNSGKYAHYAPGLCGRDVRFGGLADCALAAQNGKAPADLPTWLK